MFNKQIIDQVLKALVASASGWVVQKLNVDPALASGFAVIVYATLARLSTAIGVKGVANFFAKHDG